MGSSRRSDRCRAGSPRETQAVLAAALEAVDLGVAWFGSAGEILGINHWFRKVLRMEMRELSTMSDLHTDLARMDPRTADPEAAVARWHSRIEREETCSDELEIAKPERKTLERSAHQVKGMDGRRLGWIEIYRDITGRRLIEAKM